jgi:hypothetical protein
MDCTSHPNPFFEPRGQAHRAAQPRIWTCTTCRTEGQLTFRATGWAVLCPCPACPAPAVPEREYNPTPRAAIRHWNWKQGGPK